MTRLLTVLEDKLSQVYKVKQNGGKLFVEDKYIVEISIMDRNSIIGCDTILNGKKYITYLISVKNKEIPSKIIENLISQIGQV